MMKRKSTPHSKKKASKKKSSKNNKQKRSKSNKNKTISFLRIFLFFIFIFILYVIYLDFEVRSLFDGKKWSVPARVYARPLELYIGKPLSLKQFNFELNSSGYRKTNNNLKAGYFKRDGNIYQLVIRGFDFWDGRQPPRYIEVKIDKGFVSQVIDFRDHTDVAVVRLEPAVIGRIYPAHREDRLLLKLDDVPENLILALLAIEDRDFYSHWGINPKAILRAMVENFKAGAVVQGGSTLTQQLVKNFFLSKKKSFVRKFNEAIMALLLEVHYDKNDILQAYLNEIYLGQDKNRAIHGFGLASQYYFDKPIYSLNLSEITMLVAMVKGPSYYDPRRHKKRLIQRRNTVINVLNNQGVINIDQATIAKNKKLGYTQTVRSSHSYPAYMDLLRRQLQKDYNKEDLTSEGLQIFSTFDPYIQKTVEKVVKEKVRQLDIKNNLNNKLQSAIIVTNTNNADVVAMVGDRQPSYAGFNRALDALRPIGSLIKPAIYLTAIERKNKYSLSTIIEDKSITLKSEDGSLWSPRNYSGKSHGKIPLFKALISSYNQATVRLGLELGFESIVTTLRKLGIERDIPPYPSMLLGAVAMTPIEVAQMYQTFSADGFITPLHTIRKVLTASGEPLKTYPVKIKQTIDSTSIRIINSALHEVTQHGTAASLRWRLPKGLKVAGKTGTTNDTRDSWFAGFSGEHLIVSWLGTDTNQSTGLTGSSGALIIWSDIMKKIRTRPFSFAYDDDLEYYRVEADNGHIVDESCTTAAYLAFRKSSSPSEEGSCMN